MKYATLVNDASVLGFTWNYAPLEQILGLPTDPRSALCTKRDPLPSAPRRTPKSGHIRSPQNRPYREVVRDVDGAARQASLQRHEQRIERR